MHFKCVYLLVGLASLAAAVPAMGLVVIDDFSDGDYTNNPTWTVTSGSIDASGGELAFGTASGTTITLDFPALDNTPISVSYRLHQSNGSAGNFEFDTYMVDTDTGLFHVEYACTNPVCFGPSGFHSWTSDGSNFTAALPAAIGRSVAEAWPGYVEGGVDTGDPVAQDAEGRRHVPHRGHAREHAGSKLRSLLSRRNAPQRQ